MRKIINPFTSEQNKCFCCSRANAIGLKMEFCEDGDHIVCFWEPREDLQGFRNVLHGGVQTTLMDEIAAWAVYIKAQTGGVTKSIDVQFHKPVYINKGKLTIKCRLDNIEGSIATLRAEIQDCAGTVCSDAVVKYYIYPLEIAKKKLHYPGVERFFENK